MHAQPGQTARFEQLPGGVTRAHGVAGLRMTGQLARAEYGAKRWLWAVSLVTMAAPVLVISASGVLSKDIPLTWWLPQVLVLGLGLPGFFLLAVLYVAAPATWALKLPAGTPVYAEFGPESIGIGWLGRFNALDLDQIVEVRRKASVLIVEGVAGTELFIPGELLPPLAADLPSAYGQRRQPDPAAMNPARTQPTVPGARPGTGLDQVTRTAGIAGVGLADQLAAAARHSTEAGVALAAAVGIPLLTLVMTSLEGGGLTASSVLPAVVVMVVAVGLVGYFMYWGIPTRFRRLIPPGTPIEAEFGPQRIGLRLGGYLQTLELGSIKRIRHADCAFHVSVRGVAAGLIIAEQLVPPHVASELLARFGAT